MSRKTTNITISLDRELAEAARQLPEVTQLSLSGYIASLLRQRLEGDKHQQLDNLIDDMVSKSKKGVGSPGWKWNREDIYDRPSLRRF